MKKGKRKVSAETRKKISKANRGRKRTPEARAKMSESRQAEKNPAHGKEVSPETKAKISKSLTGRTLSDEHRANIARAHRERWQKKRLEEAQTPKCADQCELLKALIQIFRKESDVQ